MTQLNLWNVTIRGRIEGVSDDPRFPPLFEKALESNPDVALVRFQQYPWPHANSADIVITAVDKKDAEAKASDVMRKILKDAAEALGISPYGWTVGVSAELISGQGEPH
jgi:hypothetical protein